MNRFTITLVTLVALLGVLSCSSDDTDDPVTDTVVAETASEVDEDISVDEIADLPDSVTEDGMSVGEVDEEVEEPGDDAALTDGSPGGE